MSIVYITLNREQVGVGGSQQLRIDWTEPDDEVTSAGEKLQALIEGLTNVKGGIDEQNVSGLPVEMHIVESPISQSPIIESPVVVSSILESSSPQDQVHEPNRHVRLQPHNKETPNISSPNPNAARGRRFRQLVKNDPERYKEYCQKDAARKTVYRAKMNEQQKSHYNEMCKFRMRRKRLKDKEKNKESGEGKDRKIMKEEDIEQKHTKNKMKEKKKKNDKMKKKKKKHNNKKKNGNKRKDVTEDGTVLVSRKQVEGSQENLTVHSGGKKKRKEELKKKKKKGTKFKRRKKRVKAPSE